MLIDITWGRKLVGLVGESMTVVLYFIFSENWPFWLLTVPNKLSPDLE